MIPKTLAAGLRHLLLTPGNFDDENNPVDEIPMRVDHTETATGSAMLRVQFASGTFNITITKARR